MERDDFFAVIEALVDLKRSTNAWGRLEAITKAWPQDMDKHTSSSGGNSSMLALINGRIKECKAKNVVHHTLCSDHFTLPSVVIYPYGIARLTSDSIPIFEDPDKASMRAIVLEDSQQYRDLERPWLKREVEPLFNIDKSGIVFARLTDEPTVDELLLLDNILEQFEAAAS